MHRSGIYLGKIVPFTAGRSKQRDKKTDAFNGVKKMFWLKNPRNFITYGFLGELLDTRAMSTGNFIAGLFL